MTKSNILTYIKDGYKFGRVLATGTGMFKMMEICYCHKWTSDNTAMKVNPTTDKWTIYEMIQK